MEVRLVKRVLVFFYGTLVILRVNGLEFVGFSSNIEALQGQTIDLQCGFREVTKDSVVHWTVPLFQGRTLTSQSSPEGADRFSIVDSIPPPRGDDPLTSGDSVLTISSLKQSDSGIYRCSIYEDRTLIGSIEATLNVIGYNQETSGACWVNLSPVVRLGEIAELKCAVRGTNAQPDWIFKSASLGGSVMLQNNASIRTSRVNVDLIFEGQALSCRDSRTNRTLCSKELTIVYKPVVEIVPFGDVITGVDGRFNCSAIGNPQDFSYRWWYDGFRVMNATHHRFNRLTLETNGKTLVIPDVIDDDKGKIITCEVTNSLGSQNATHVITADDGRSLGERIGPYLVAVVILLIILLLIGFLIWWKRQKKMVRKISSRRRALEGNFIKDDISGTALDNGSFVPVSPMDLEAIGYGPDQKPYQISSGDPQLRYYNAIEVTDRDSGLDDDGIRPIPRRLSTNSDGGKLNHGFVNDKPQVSRDMSFESHETAPVDEHEEKMKSYTYEVNPNFNSYRKQYGVVPIPDDSMDISDGDDSDNAISETINNFDDDFDGSLKKRKEEPITEL